jgi:hypothetical protein
MKPSRSTNCRALLEGAFLACFLGGALASFGAPTNAPAIAGQTNALPAGETAFPKSEFDERAGKDPFFPYRVLTPAVKPPVESAPSEAGRLLALNGLFGTANRPLATINGRPFEVGEEGEITTSAGKLKIRCLEIHKDSVVVEITETREHKELRLRSKP